MDIYLLRDGQQTGPFAEDAVQSLLKSGEITLDDFAWRDGLATWQPLHAVLYPKSATQKILPPPPADAPTPTPEPFMSPVATAVEPATARQKAFLTYLGIAFPGDLAKDRAAVLLNDAIEDPKHSARVKRWEDEKLRLHPDLFADEIQARREQRPQHFLEICHTDGADFFNDVTKAHAQVLVGYLDVQHPHWDEHADAARYFFAAIAEKFPQLVKAGARGQLKFPDGPKAAVEMQRSGVATRPRRKRSPLVAALRGIAIGLVVLAALYGASVFYERHVAALLDPAASQAALPDVPLPTPPLAAEPAPEPPAKTEPIAQTAPATPTPAPAAPTLEAAPAAPMQSVASPTPAPATPEPATPAPAMIAAATPTPAPAALLPMLDPAPNAAVATPAPATPAPRTSVKITKPTQVMLRFGSSTLAAGTVVPLVSVEGASAMVRFGPDVIPVPIANTDLSEPPRQ